MTAAVTRAGMADVTMPVIVDFDQAGVECSLQSLAQFIRTGAQGWVLGSGGYPARGHNRCLASEASTGARMVRNPQGPVHSRPAQSLAHPWLISPPVSQVLTRRLSVPLHFIR